MLRHVKARRPVGMVNAVVELDAASRNSMPEHPESRALASRGISQRHMISEIRARNSRNIPRTSRCSVSVTFLERVTSVSLRRNVVTASRTVFGSGTGAICRYGCSDASDHIAPQRTPLRELLDEYAGERLGRNGTSFA